MPEAQLDRFLCCIRVDYPTLEEELQVATTAPATSLDTVQPVLSAEQLLEFQNAARAVPVSSDVARHAVNLVVATRPGTASSDIEPFLECGASPRASQAPVLAGQARAMLHGRVHVDFEDIRALAPSILRHRLVLNFRARAERIDADELVRRVLAQVKPA